ncbi:MAG: hypothetical protein RL574_1005 [Actinomycetota bacterium]
MSQREFTRMTWRDFTRVWAGFFALLTAWMLVLPLFAGPDEPANFIKSAAVVRGEFVGEPIAASVSTSFWSTYVDIDPQFGTAQLVPWCFVSQPTVPACDKPLATLTPVEPSRTDMGRYPPLGFVPAGIGTLIGASDAGARAARITAALACAALLALAALTLRRSGGSLVPLLAVATPGVLFWSSVSSPSGLEIAAAIAAWSALWSAVREGWADRFTIIAFVLSAALLIAARPAGLVAVAVMGAAAAITDHRALVHAVRREWYLPVALGAATVVSAAWYVSVYDANFGVRLEVEGRVTSLSTIASRSLNDLPRLIGEWIGNFGWLDTPSPVYVVWAFVALWTALVWRTITSVHRLQQVALFVVTLAGPLWLVALSANYQDLLGSFGAQGRHLAPLLVGIPLAAALSHRVGRRDSWLMSVALVLHAWCVLVALRRYSMGAGGDDLLGFVREPMWSPPLGMGLTLVVVAVAHVAAWFALRSPVGGFLRSPAGRIER